MMKRRRRNCVSRVDHLVVVVSLSRGSFLLLLAFVSLVVVVGVVVSSLVLLFLHLDFFGRYKNIFSPVFFFRLLLPACLLREQLL